MPTPNPNRQAHKPHGLSKEKSEAWEEAERLDRVADRLEETTKNSRETADFMSESGAPLEQFPGQRAKDKEGKAGDWRYSAGITEKQAKKYREEAQKLRNFAQDAPVESVLGDIEKGTYGPMNESVLDDIPSEVSKQTSFKQLTHRPVFWIGVGALTLAGFAGVGYFSQTTTPASPSSQIVEEKTAPPVSAVSGNMYSYDGKQYYIVRSDVSAEDTGNEVCAKAGKQCVGYTALSLDVCLAFHPGVRASQDLNGSKAGFYCNGPPQGGVCAKETNTCHICSQCNLNMECDTVIGDFYRETYVECR